MSVDLDQLRERWGAAAAGFIPLHKVDRETLQEKLELAVADIDALVCEVESLRAARAPTDPAPPPASINSVLESAAKLTAEVERRRGERHAPDADEGCA